MALFSARIKELETQLSASNQERDGLKVKVDELTVANADCETRFQADQATILTLTTERDEARTNLTTVTTERDAARTDLQTERASRETAISDEVNKRLGSAGAEPIKRDPKATVDTSTGGKAAGSPRERLASDFNTKLQK